MKADEEILALLHNAVAEALVAKVKSGEATAAELAVSIKFLKDNGITAVLAPDSPLSSLVDELDMPFDRDGRPVEK
jgi:HKD family nuclease